MSQLLTRSGTEQNLKTARARSSSLVLFTLKAPGSWKLRGPGSDLGPWAEEAEEEASVLRNLKERRRWTVVLIIIIIITAGDLRVRAALIGLKTLAGE